MSLNSPDRNLVNRYLGGDLSGIELENFRKMMQDDDAFKAEVNFQHLLRSGILFSKEDELKKIILATIRFRKTHVPYALKLIFTFIVVTTLGITLWFYIGKDSLTHRKVDLLFPFLSKEKDKNAEKKITKDKVADEYSRPVTTDSMAVNSVNQNSNEDLTATGEPAEDENKLSSNDSTSHVNSEDKDIVIKKDQLMISVSLPVNEKITEKKLQENMQANATENVVQKLNPAANIPEGRDEVTANMEVEFWVSPVNYRGYKMTKNKLLLFGIEEPDGVKLFRSNDVLYMKYNNDFFHLVNTFEFLSYQRLKETDVPLAIRQ